MQNFNDFLGNIEEDVDFDAETFKFNRYELDDGTILRFFGMPIKIFRTKQKDPSGNPVYLVNTNSVVSAVVDNDARTQPEQPVPPEQMKLSPIDFKEIAEPWNVFSLSDGTVLRIRFVANQIKRAKNKNQFGEHIYFIDHNMSLDVRPPQIGS